MISQENPACSDCFIAGTTGSLLTEVEVTSSRNCVYSETGKDFYAK